MKKLLLLSAFLATAAAASSIKVWTAAETVTAADLNANFSHLHSNLGRGHGAVITNADIKSTAAIAMSKLASTTLIPKAWGSTQAGCSGSASANVACGTLVGGGIAAITSSGVSGVFNVFLSALPADNAFVVSLAVGQSDTLCFTSTKSVGTLWPTTTTPQFKVVCTFATTGAARDAVTQLDVIVMDN